MRNFDLFEKGQKLFFFIPTFSPVYKLLHLPFCLDVAKVILVIHCFPSPNNNKVFIYKGYNG